MSHEHDPMELAEIENLKARIRLVRDRLAAAGDESAPRSDADIEQLKAELFSLQEQLERLSDVERN